MHKLWLPLLLGLFFFASCSEDEETIVEFPNWQATNDQAFQKVMDYAKEQTATGNNDQWKIFLDWSLENQSANMGGFIEDYGDEYHIAVQVLEKGTGSGCPLYTDSVLVHYRGRLLPSTSYEEGYVIDESYTGEFNDDTALPVKMYVGSLIDGFTTALMQMHIGDRWMVYIPSQLGYGSTESANVPAYSMLRFDIKLVGYYSLRSGIADSASLAEGLLLGGQAFCRSLHVPCLALGEGIAGCPQK